MTSKMPNGILNANNNANSNNVKQQIFTIQDDKHHLNGTLKKYPDKAGKQDDTQPSNQQTNSILNVAEMLLHGVADQEILEIWLRSISCQEFVNNFLESGYDMPTISRVTPQDLTAIGITNPSKRSKIISEIKKLNLQDGIPNFRPVSLSQWLALLRLDSNYYKSLCDQNIDTVDKVCQLTWEDFEELGITKLGHQKRLQLAIERIKDLANAEINASSKAISEPIYDTNSSQILLLASSENHSMNGPIINKQSSTSELSSTGSGSMHSIYSTSSHHQQTSNAAHQTNNITNADTNGRQQQKQQQHQQQVIYSQSPSQSYQQQQMQQQAPMLQTPPSFSQPAPPLPPPNLANQMQLLNSITPIHNQAIPQPLSMSQYQSAQTQLGNLSLNDSLGQKVFGNNNVAPPHLHQHHNQTNRQSLGQLPFTALANLPRHQQQLLQQSSIYATLSRQPQRVKQPPPPVPIRTNSLKSNSLIDEEDTRQRNEQFLRNSIMNSLNSPQRQSSIYGEKLLNANTANNLIGIGSRLTNRNQFNMQLQKNKSFSGDAYMDAARARFLNRNNSQPQPPTIQQRPQQQPSLAPNQVYSTINVTQNIQQLTDGATSTGSIYNTAINGHHVQQYDIYGTHTLPHASAADPRDAGFPDGHMRIAQPKNNGNGPINASATLDDDFPPPPSPLSLADYDPQTMSEFS